jgi:hypothetical protein
MSFAAFVPRTIPTTIETHSRKSENPPIMEAVDVTTNGPDHGLGELRP